MEVVPTDSNVAETRINTLQKIYASDLTEKSGEKESLEEQESCRCTVEEVAYSTVRILQDAIKNVMEVYNPESESCCSPEKLQKKLSDIKNAIGDFSKKMKEVDIKCECQTVSAQGSAVPAAKTEEIDEKNVKGQNESSSEETKTSNVKSSPNCDCAEAADLQIQTSFLTICACPCHVTEQKEEEIKVVMLEDSLPEVNKDYECPCGGQEVENKSKFRGKEMSGKPSESVKAVSYKEYDDDCKICACKSGPGNKGVGSFHLFNCLERATSPIVVMSPNTAEREGKNVEFVSAGDGAEAMENEDSNLTVEFLMKKESANKVESISGSLLVKKIISIPDTKKKKCSSAKCSPDAAVSLPDIRDAVVIRLPVVGPQNRQQIDLVINDDAADEVKLDNFEIMCECASLLVANMEMKSSADDLAALLLTELLNRVISGDLEAVECITSLVTDIAGSNDESRRYGAEGDSSRTRSEEQLYIQKLLHEILESLAETEQFPIESAEEDGGIVCICEGNDLVPASDNRNSEYSRNVYLINKTLIITLVNTDGTLEVTMNSINEKPNSGEDGAPDNSPLREHSFTFMHDNVDQEPYLDTFFWDTSVTVQTDLTLGQKLDSDSLDSVNCKLADPVNEMMDSCASCRKEGASVDWDMIIVPPSNAIELKMVKRAERERPRRSPFYDKIEHIQNAKDIAAKNMINRDPAHPCFPNDDYQVAPSSDSESEEDFIPRSAASDEKTKKKKKKGCCSKGEVEEEPKPERKKPKKVREHPCRGPGQWVYDPDGEAGIMIEPYTERLASMFPDEPCTDRTELPWKDIVLSRNVRLYPEPRLTDDKRVPRAAQPPQCKEGMPLCVCKNEDKGPVSGVPSATCPPPKRCAKQLAFEIIIPRECGQKFEDDLNFFFRGTDGSSDRQIKFGENIEATSDSPFNIETKKTVTCKHSSYIINIKPSTECPYPSEEMPVEEPRFKKSNVEEAKEDGMDEGSQLITVVDPPVVAKTKSECSTDCSGGAKKKKNVNIDPESTNISPCGSKSAPEIMQSKESSFKFKATVYLKRTGKPDEVLVPDTAVDDSGNMVLKVPVSGNEDGTLPSILVKIHASKSKNAVSSKGPAVEKVGSSCENKVQKCDSAKPSCEILASKKSSAGGKVSIKITASSKQLQKGGSSKDLPCPGSSSSKKVVADKPSDCTGSKPKVEAKVSISCPSPSVSAAPCDCGSASPFAKVKSNSNQILEALQKYEREMKPLKEALNTLHTKLHSMNLTELKQGFSSLNTQPSAINFGNFYPMPMPLPPLMAPPLGPLPYEPPPIQRQHYASSIVPSPVYGNMYNSHGQGMSSSNRQNISSNAGISNPPVSCPRSSNRGNRYPANQVLLPPREARGMPMNTESSCPFINAVHSLSRTLTNKEPSQCPFIKAVREIGSRGHLQRGPRQSIQQGDDYEFIPEETDEFDGPGSSKRPPQEDSSLQNWRMQCVSKCPASSATRKGPSTPRRSQQWDENAGQGREESSGPRVQPRFTCRKNNGETCMFTSVSDFIKFLNDDVASNPDKYEEVHGNRREPQNKNRPAKNQGRQRQMCQDSPDSVPKCPYWDAEDMDGNAYEQPGRYRGGESDDENYCPAPQQQQQQRFQSYQRQQRSQSRVQVRNTDSCFLSWCPYAPGKVEVNESSPYVMPVTPYYPGDSEPMDLPCPKQIYRPFQEILASIRRRKSVTSAQCPAATEHNSLDFRANVSSNYGGKKCPARQHGSPGGCYDACPGRNRDDAAGRRKGGPGKCSYVAKKPSQVRCKPGCPGRTTERKENEGCKQITVVKCPTQQGRAHQQANRPCGPAGYRTTITAKFPRMS